MNDNFSNLNLINKHIAHCLLSHAEKVNQAMKFGQAKNTTREILFFKLHTENNELGRLEFQTLFVCFFKKKLFYEVEASGLQLGFSIFR